MASNPSPPQRPPDAAELPPTDNAAAGHETPAVHAAPGSIEFEPDARHCHEVFISYSARDKRWADAACAVLEGHRIRCWIAPRDILPGSEWGAAIVEGIDACQLMVLIFSGHANESPQVRREVERAISKGIAVLPVRVEDTRPTGAMEFALSNTHWLDAFTLPVERQMALLAESVQALLAKLRQKKQLESKGGGTGEAQASAGQAPASIPVTPPNRRLARRRYDADPTAMAEGQQAAAPSAQALTASGDGDTLTHPSPLPPAPQPDLQPFGKLGLVAALFTVGGVGLLVSIYLLLNRPAPVPAPEEIVNSLGMPLVLIPAGRFKMGSPNSDKDVYDREKPQHDVEITQVFYLGKHEVTRGQFRQFVDAAGYKTEAEGDGQGGLGFNKETKEFEGRKPEYTWRNAGFDQTDEHPVVNVTWNDAKAFCAWLSQTEGQEYRLPTEAEWEYSCRATTTTPFHSGDDKETLFSVANVADASAKEMFPHWITIRGRDGYVFTAPVGRFKPNDFGLLDMHGNVSEWCEDWFDENYYKNSPAKNPKGPAAGSFRVFRGGTFYYLPWNCRATYRNWDKPAHRGYSLGFRVVRER
jgi:formylglycine-generating enzyme required for sulfatase activity